MDAAVDGYGGGWMRLWMGAAVDGYGGGWMRPWMDAAVDGCGGGSVRRWMDGDGVMDRDTHIDRQWGCGVYSQLEWFPTLRMLYRCSGSFRKLCTVHI
jgi:hypothetical protein